MFKLCHCNSVGCTGLHHMVWVVGVFPSIILVETTEALNCRLVFVRYRVRILPMLPRGLTERLIIVLCFVTRWIPSRYHWISSDYPFPNPSVNSWFILWELFVFWKLWWSGQRELSFVHTPPKYWDSFLKACNDCFLHIPSYSAFRLKLAFDTVASTVHKPRTSLAFPSRWIL